MSEIPHSIYLVDDHPLVREWLTALIHQESDLVVCGSAESPRLARVEIERLQPRLVIIDLSFTEGSGIDLIREVRELNSQIKIIVLSMHDEQIYGERALKAGADGYIVKRETADQIVTAIRRVLDGRPYLSPSLAELVAIRSIHGSSGGGASPIDSLSDRELQVFELLGRGFLTRDIAKELHVSIKTIQVYCARIKTKLAIENARELLRQAILWCESNH